jgi:predicted nucleotidyltransferase
MSRQAEGDLEAVRRQLMTVARRYADRLESQPGVVGILLYGSLASGNQQEVTALTDIDIALVLDRALPAHFTEHRLLGGVKVDVLLFQASALRDLVSRQPERLYQDGWVTHFLIRSLLLGSPETILFDPTGEIGRTKAALNMLTDYETMALPDARIWLTEVEREYLAPASEHLQEGNVLEALNKAEAALRKLSSIVLLMACTKNLTSAAQKLGIPQFPVAAAE